MNGASNNKHFSYAVLMVIYTAKANVVLTSWVSSTNLIIEHVSYSISYCDALEIGCSNKIEK